MKKLIPAIIILLMISLPYIYASIAPGGTMVFGGFLMNSLDGNSYLAKMEEGARGEWLFTLPFTAEKGEGVPLFTFYIFLGHLAGCLHIPLIWMFHVARIGAAIFLLWSLAKFSTHLFPDSSRQANRFFLLVSLGSGLGWLFYSISGMTADFWVAEAYPFLSMYTNPHFPLGLGLMLWLLSDGRYGKWKGFLLDCGLGVLLSIILPFGVVLVGLILGIHWVWDCVSKGNWRFPWEVTALLPGVFWVGGQYLFTLHNPLMAAWNRQNVTAAPNIWDWIVSFSPALILMFFALNKNKMEEIQVTWKKILIWAAAATILQVIPFSLQRRFLLGFYIPLAAFSIQAIHLFGAKVRKWLWPVTLLLSVPTNLILIATGLFAAGTLPRTLYLTPAESSIYTWIAENTPLDSVILCGPRSGNRIPAYTGRRVMYGHPFETADASVNEKAIRNYFADPLSVQSNEWLVLNDIGYILVGDEEQEMLGDDLSLPGKVVFQNGEYQLFYLDNP